MRHILARIATALLMTVLAAPSCPAQTTRNDTPPLSIRAAVANGAAPLGAPVVVKFTLRNRTDGVLYLAAPGVGGRSRGTVRLLAADSSLKVRTDVWSLTPEGTVGYFVRLGPHQAIVETGVMDAWGNWTKPGREGRYRIVIECSVPFRVDAETSAEAYTFVTTIDAPLFVTKPDDERLRKRAAELRDSILARRGKITNVADPDVDELFAMPPGVGIPIWHELVSDLRQYAPISSVILDRLAALRTPAAANLLADIWGAPRTPYPELRARHALLTMYTVGSPALRDYVGKLFIEREGKLPDPIRIQVHYADGPR